jgi:hypothetical protein
MANGDPTKWKHFEQMDFPEFLILAEYYKDKQDESERQQRLRRK